MTTGTGAGPPIAVVGGGITGLTIAFRLKKAGCAVCLFEAGPRVGGAIATHREDGWLFEFGPNTVLANEAVDRLVHDAGAAPERLTAAPAAKTRFVVRGGRLVPMPSSPPAFFKSPLFGLGTKLRLLREPFVPPNRGGDESIADFVRRRLGREMLDYAVGPFVSGVYAGDPEKLSVRHAVKKIHALEANHGSLIRGALALAKEGAEARRKARENAKETPPAGADDAPPPSSGADAGAARRPPAPNEAMSVTPRGALLSFRNGLDTLPDAVAEFLGPDLLRNAPVTGIVRSPGGAEPEAAGGAFVVRYRSEDGEREFTAGRVIVAVDAPRAAALLSPLDAGGLLAGAGVKDVPYAGVVVSGLGFRREDITHPLSGFGFLVPRVEPTRMLGCLFVSSLFPARAPDGHHALTVIYGGAMDREAVDLEDGALLELARRELTPLLGLRAKPVMARIRRWPRAIPQYNLGHETYLNAVRGLEAAHPGLTVTGNWVNGISVGDCIRSASEIASRIAAATRADDR